MKLLPEYINRLKRFEGFRSKAYKPQGEKDTNGVLTIGYGHLGAKCGQEITEAEAEFLLLEDVARVELQLRAILPATLKLSDARYTALVDFVFNCGIRAFQRSTLFKLIKYDQDDIRIPNEFLRWVYSGGRLLQGLVRRRRYCRELWLRGRAREERKTTVCHG